jgi:hypothetical protein
MTVAELRAALEKWPSDYPVTVAGGGRLALVTHGAAEDGTRVVVLYVADPPPPIETPGPHEPPLPFEETTR